MQKHSTDQSLIPHSITLTACEVFWMACCVLSNCQCAANISLGRPCYHILWALELSAKRLNVCLSTRVVPGECRKGWKIRGAKCRLSSRSQSLFWDSAAEILKVAAVGHLERHLGLRPLQSLSSCSGFHSVWRRVCVCLFERQTE